MKRNGMLALFVVAVFGVAAWSQTTPSAVQDCAPANVFANWGSDYASPNEALAHLSVNTVLVPEATLNFTSLILYFYAEAGVTNIDVWTGAKATTVIAVQRDSRTGKWRVAGIAASKATVTP